MKMAVFWFVAPWGAINGAIKLIFMMMEALRSSERFVNLYQSTRHYKPEDSHLDV
jgi:hypothetical protein